MNVSKTSLTDSLHNEPDTSIYRQNNLLFRKTQRLLKPSLFTTVFADAPIRASHPNFLILARKNTIGIARLGLVIPKKHVRRANQRNQIKRIARETFRLEQHKLAALDAIVLARRGADLVPKQQLTSIFNGLWKRLNKRAHAPDP